MKQQQQQQHRRNLTAPLSRSRKRKKVPIAAIVLALVGLVGIAGLLYFVSLQSQAKRRGSGVRNVSVDQIASHQQVDEANVAGNEQEEEETGDPPATDGGSHKTLVLSTKIGRIRIMLRPDLSLESTQYLTELAKAESCARCNFYRAEGSGILQGIMDHPGASTTVARGPCPPEYANEKQPACPEWDPKCGCHGPTMTRGMVGWAGGGTGPDFFIDTYKDPAKFWGQQHTVFGEIQDEESLALIDTIYELPVYQKGMTYLKEKIHFTVDLG